MTFHHLLRIGIALFLSAGQALAQSPPKHELRGTWISTVLNLDWPQSRTASPSVQQADLTTHLDELKKAGVNAVFFQVRTEADALYASPYEPWSYYLTNQEGVAPNPFWDPLAFAIQEAHKRGMELHAWLNPYRAVRVIGAYTRAASHISNTHPDWLLTIGTFRFLNPGLPQVQDHITKVAADIVRRYAVDGIHFDDYFYPYAPNSITTEDEQTFAQYGGGFSNIGDWRRDNVNRMIAAVHDSIKALKPHVKFGVSPFGIWRPNNPPGISGTDAYATIYADAKAWIADGSVDYLVPQVYWAFGGGQDYAKLVPWWKTTAVNRHIYTGNAAYKMSGSTNWPVSEILNQVRFNRTEAVAGHVQFRSRFIHNNTKGLADSLSAGLHAHPAIPPVMPWLDSTPPPAPVDVLASVSGLTGNQMRLSWGRPTFAPSATDTVLRYAVYRMRSATQPSIATLTGDASNLRLVTGLTTYQEELPYAPEPYWYVVTSISSNSVESANPVMRMVTVTSPMAVYHAKGTGRLDVLSTWGADSDGSGVAPTSFSANQQRFVITREQVAMNHSWTVAGGGSQVVIGNGVTSTTVVVGAGHVLDAAIEIMEGGDLVLDSDSEYTHPIVSSVGAVNGPVAARRFVDASPQAASQGGAFKFLANPFGSPLTGSADRLLSGVWTQGAGIQGVSSSTGAPNLWTFDPLNGATAASGSVGLRAGWVPVADLGAPIPAGAGFLMYVFTNDAYGVAGSWPKVLSARGVPGAHEHDGSDIALPMRYGTWSEGDASVFGWNLVGNPFIGVLDWDAPSGWTRQQVSNAIHIIRDDGSVASYVSGGASVNGGSRYVAPFQSFLVKADGPSPVLSVRKTAKVNQNSRFLKEAESTDINPMPSLRIQLQRMQADSVSQTVQEVLVTRRDAHEPQLGVDAAFFPGFDPRRASMRLEDPGLGSFYIRDLSGAWDHRVLALLIELPDTLRMEADRYRLHIVNRLGDDMTIEMNGMPVEPMRSLNLRLQDVDDSGTGGSTRRIPLSFESSTSTSTENGKPTTVNGFELAQNYPNPFNPGTQIRFTLDAPRATRLTVYDLLGREVAVLVDGLMPAGAHRVSFDASDLASGVYVYKLEADGQLLTRRMTLVK